MYKIFISVFLIAFSYNKSYSQLVDETLYTVVESMPVFSEKCDKENSEGLKQCTIKSIQAYVAKIEYPEKAIKKNISGKVFVSFVVDKDGSIIDVTLLRGVHKLIDNASLNHIKKMPSFFKPGYQRGKAVKVKYNIPVVFKL